MDTEESNPLTGAVGALIGSLLGVLAIVILGQIGYVAVVSGVVMGFGTLVGYSMLGGSLDLKGIIISVIIMIIMIFVANRMNWAFYVIRAVPEVGFFRAFFRFGEVVSQNAEIASKYHESLFADYLFCALGAFSYMKKGKGEGEGE